MPYAANGQISTEPQDGWVEITDEQYQAALEGMMAGKVVAVDGGFAVVDPPESEPEPFPEPQPPTPEQQQAAIAAAIDAHVEATARERGYNGAAHLASYVTSTVGAWQAEATTFVAWRDAVWLAAYAMLADALAEGEAPQAEDALAALPMIEWPE